MSKSLATAMIGSLLFARVPDGEAQIVGSQSQVICEWRGSSECAFKIGPNKRVSIFRNSSTTRLAFRHRQQNSGWQRDFDGNLRLAVRS